MAGRAPAVSHRSRGVVALTHTRLPLLRQAPSGRFVNVSSRLASVTWQADPTSAVAPHKYFAYGTSKTALNVFAIYLADALPHTRIKVNAAHPGWMNTEMGGIAAVLELSEGGKTSGSFFRIPKLRWVSMWSLLRTLNNEERRLMVTHLGQHAVVIGGSLAGLMTAQVLADHFDAVTVIERDHIDTRPALHQSIPQGSHLHVLLLGGQQVMASLYPGFIDKLERLGGVRIRVGKDVVYYMPDGKAYTRGGSVREPRDLGFDIHAQSRGLLEYCVRQCTLAQTHVQLHSDCLVHGLVLEDGRVHGVRYTQGGDSQTLPADFVVDAGGRGSHVPRWLTALGFPTPNEMTLGVDFAYSSAQFRKPTFYAEESLMLCYGPPPHQVRQGFLETIEGGLLHVSLGGRFGEYPPDDAAGFFAFAKSLYTPVLYNLIKDAERVTAITHYRYPTSIRRHYERLSAFPEGLLVLGDALCSFNPVYGQGMSSAALQVQALQQLLTERATGGQGLEGLAWAFFPKVEEVIATPWTLAANQDFAYPQTTGERPPGLAERREYLAALDALTVEDVELQRLMFEVFHLAKPLSLLNEEPLRRRVFAQQR